MLETDDRTSGRPAGVARKRRSDPRSARTRARLLEAAKDLLHGEGLSELSVSAIARRAGVRQSLFYYHFPTLEDCLVAIARRVVDRLEPLDRELRANASWNQPVGERVVAFYEQALEHWLAEGDLVELLITHRLDTSAFGREMRRHRDQLAEELAAEFWEHLAAWRLPGDAIADVRLLADQLVCQWYWAIETLVSGRSHDRARTARALANSVDALVSSTLRIITESDDLAIIERRIGPALRQQLAAQRSEALADLGSHDDGELCARHGGAEQVVDAAMQRSARGYLPELCTASCDVRYRIDTPEGEVVRTWRFDQQGIHPLPDDTPVQLTLSLSLRTLLEALAGALTPQELMSRIDYSSQGGAAQAYMTLDRCFYVPA